MEQVDCLLDVAWMQATGDNQLADAVNDSGPGLNALPIEGLPSAAAPFGRRRVQHNAGEYSRSKAVGLQKQIAILRHMNFVHAFPFVSLVWSYQPSRNRIPSYRSFTRSIKKFCGITAKNHWPFRAIGEPLMERATEFRGLVTAQLHHCQSSFLYGISNAFHGLVHKHANFFNLLRSLRG